MKVFLNVCYLWTACQRGAKANYETGSAHIETAVKMHWWLGDRRPEVSAALLSPRARDSNINIDNFKLMSGKNSKYRREGGEIVNVVTTVANCRSTGEPSQKDASAGCSPRIRGLQSPRRAGGW